ncbi:MAG: hypothetical protein M0D57_14380 [Sphingobacteriales bacterium JAD_PAG50586_3]|nr:MAG: hypothetical protein M0D57_14380 [Sphingobacteriales bacterium JAD_PAG50586_3]
MENIYDKFEPFIQLPAQEFDFRSSRHEVWENGKMINGGNSNTNISCVKTLSDEKEFNIHEKSKIDLDNIPSNINLNKSVIFDLLITQTDRLQLISVPDNKFINCIGLQAMKLMIGQTTNKIPLLSNPYCCSIFLKENKILKISFSFDNPEKLIEFYK